MIILCESTDNKSTFCQLFIDDFTARILLIDLIYRTVRRLYYNNNMTCLLCREYEPSFELSYSQAYKSERGKKREKSVKGVH